MIDFAFTWSKFLLDITPLLCKFPCWLHVFLVIFLYICSFSVAHDRLGLFGVSGGGKRSGRISGLEDVCASQPCI